MHVDIVWTVGGGKKFYIFSSFIIHYGGSMLVMCVNLPEELKNICKDDLDRQILLLRCEGNSIDDIAKKVGYDKSTVSRRLKRLRECGFEDSFDIAKDAKKDSLKIGRIGETGVEYVLDRKGVRHKWTGKEIGRHPDFEIYNRRKNRNIHEPIVCELKNRKKGAYLTEAEVKRDVLPRFEGYDDCYKVLFIPSGVRIVNGARKLLKENGIKIVRIGEQIRDLGLLTLLRLYFRFERIGLFEMLSNSGLAEKSYPISDGFFELLIMTLGAIEKCGGADYEKGRDVG